MYIPTLLCVHILMLTIETSVIRKDRAKTKWGMLGRLSDLTSGMFKL